MSIKKGLRFDCVLTQLYHVQYNTYIVSIRRSSERHYINEVQNNKVMFNGRRHVRQCGLIVTGVKNWQRRIYTTSHGWNFFLLIFLRDRGKSMLERNISICDFFTGFEILFCRYSRCILALDQCWCSSLCECNSAFKPILGNRWNGCL